MSTQPPQNIHSNPSKKRRRSEAPILAQQVLSMGSDTVYKVHFNKFRYERVPDKMKAMLMKFDNAIQGYVAAFGDLSEDEKLFEVALDRNIKIMQRAFLHLYLELVGSQPAPFEMQLLASRYAHLSEGMKLVLMRFERDFQAISEHFEALPDDQKAAVRRVDRDKTLQKACFYLHNKVAGVTTEQDNIAILDLDSYKKTLGVTFIPKAPPFQP